MPIYGLPGVALDPRKSLRIGVATLVTVAALLIAWAIYTNTRDDGRIGITLHTEELGTGIVTGSTVQVNGVAVGSVASINSAEHGTQEIGLRIDRSAARLLTTDMSVLYAPGNLFGIGQVQLVNKAGGMPLRDGQSIDLTGARATTVTDATMSALLRSLTDTSTKVLTPQLTDVLRQVGTDVHAFTPLLQALVSVSRSVADTQQYDPAFLLQQYASALGGLPPFIDGTVDVLTTLNENPVLRNKLPLFNAGVAMISSGFFPAIGAVGTSSGKYLSDYGTMFVPLLTAVGHVVSTPVKSGIQLRQLLDRLNAAYTTSPQGPILHIDAILAGVPALATPLADLVAGVPR